MKTVVLNESDSALDAFCMSHGTSIVFLDEKLAALPDDNVNKRELTRLRRKMEDAHKGKDMGQLEGWFYALLIGLKAACLTIPLAEKGTNYGKAQSKAASAPRKLTIDQQKSIAKTYWQRVDMGEKYGALKELSGRFGVSTETVRITVKKYKQKSITK